MTKKASKKRELDKEATKLFEEYYFSLRKSIFWYIYKKVNNQELAEDITAEVFLKLAERQDILKDRDENGIKAWLYTVSRNRVIDYYRKLGRKTKQVQMEEEIFEIVSKEEGHYLENEIQEENNVLLLTAVDELSPIEKEIITLRFNEDMRFSEIADIVGKNEGAVKMTLYRALEKLKGEMAGDLDSLQI
jgi:RNA polymerase sigma-70 factor (ECF subfamily)